MQHRRSPEAAAKQSAESALEAEATSLLRDHAVRYARQEYPFYMPSSLRQMSDRDDALSHRELRGAWGEDDTPTRLLEALCGHVELNETNRAVLEMTRQGLRAAEVAQRLQLTPKAVRRRLDRIVARLRHAAASGSADRLVREAYDEQLKPQRYQPEQHCRPGREACRRDGRCRFRWYLYAITAEQEGE